MPLAVFAAIIFSTMVVVAVTTTGLQRTPLCALAGLGIAMMLWDAYPPARQLSPVVGFLFWVLMTLLIYYFPEPAATRAADQDEELLDRFFEETNR
jgi:hypothetical protein